MTVTVRVAEPDASRPASCRRCNDYKRRNPTDQVRHVPSHDRTARGCRNSARSVQRDIRLAGVSVTVIGAFSVPDVPPLYYTPALSLPRIRGHLQCDGDWVHGTTETTEVHHRVQG